MWIQKNKFLPALKLALFSVIVFRLGRNLIERNWAEFRIRIQSVQKSCKKWTLLRLFCMPHSIDSNIRRWAEGALCDCALIGALTPEMLLFEVQVKSCVFWIYTWSHLGNTRSQKFYFASFRISALEYVISFSEIPWSFWLFYSVTYFWYIEFRFTRTL